MNAENEHPGLPENRLWQPVTVKWFCAIFGAALGYSILRYHITSEVAWAHFPLFILNKATSLAAVGIVALWAVAIPATTTLPMMPKAIGGKRWKRTQRMGYLCLSLVVAHMVAFGLKGWLALDHWPWGLPPISMLAVIAAAIPLLAKLWQLFGKR